MTPTSTSCSTLSALTIRVSGKLNFTLHAAGTAADPHGQGQISMKDGQAHGRPIASLTSQNCFC